MNHVLYDKENRVVVDSPMLCRELFLTETRTYQNLHLTNVRFLGDGFIFGFVAADCECVFISCHGQTDG